jgi:quinol monooxygenase YgiN
MAEVLVICRSVARTGTEVQLRALLQGMLAPTHAEPGCKLYNFMSQTQRDVSIFTKHGKVKLRLINIWQRPTLSAWNKPTGNW